MKSGENNVLVVDWSELARAPFYTLARVHVLPVAARVAKVVDLLVKHNLTEPALVHLVGYGLGGHVAGIAAKLVTTGKVKRVTGKDLYTPSKVTCVVETTSIRQNSTLISPPISFRHRLDKLLFVTPKNLQTFYLLQHQFA